MKTISTMRAVDEEWGAVRVEDVYDTGIDDLWDACTTPERLARWIGDLTGDVRDGGDLRLSLTSGWAGPVRIDYERDGARASVELQPRRSESAAGPLWQIGIAPQFIFNIFNATVVQMARALA